MMNNVAKQNFKHKSSSFFSVCSSLLILVVFIFAALFSGNTSAQEIVPSKKAKIICPEIAKLAESVTLARENQMPQAKALEIINSTMKLEKSEYDVINKMVSYIYSNSEKPIYENTIYILFECYKYLN